MRFEIKTYLDRDVDVAVFPSNAVEEALIAALRDRKMQVIFSPGNSSTILRFRRPARTEERSK